MLGVKMPAHEVFVPIDYSHDLGDNLDVLMNKLLEKYPQLTDWWLYEHLKSSHTKNATDYLLSNFIRTFVDEPKQHITMNLGDIFEKDYYFEFEPRKNYETGKVAHKLPRGTNEPLRFTIEEMYLLDIRQRCDTFGL